jgi:hypothetical protein
LIVDCCLCPHHRCCPWCLHRHHGKVRWQHGGSGSCHSHARRRHAANALPATAATTLPASCRCRQRRASRCGAGADDATLPPCWRQAAKLAAANALPSSPLLPHYCCRRVITTAALSPSPLPCCQAAAIAAAAALPPLLLRRCRRCRAAAANAALPPRTHYI